MQGDEKIGKAAIRPFKKLFNLENVDVDNKILNCIHSVITQEENDMLTSMPDDEDIKDIIFNMRAHSSAGSDGYNGVFYHTCWHIIKEDIVAFVQYFFKGKSLTNFFSHTCLVLIPKRDSPSDFYDLRSISLSNFSNKIISKILTRRLNSLLTNLISENKVASSKED